MVSYLAALPAALSVLMAGAWVVRRWRWFFLATAGVFGYSDGSEWGISHYRMKPS
jgi:hypothetical protein